MHNSTLVSTFLHGPSMTCFGWKLSLLHNLWFILWYHFLLLLFLACLSLEFFWKVFYISRQHANTNNSCNWTASSSLISLDAIIFPRGLYCSSVVRLSYYIFLSFSSLVDPYEIKLGTYDDIELGSSEVSTEGTTFFLI